MKNNFKKNGRMVIRFETVEERREIIRILEEQRGFRIEDELKQSDKIHPYDTRTFLINLKHKTYTYWIRPFIGAAMMSGGIRAYSAQEFFRIAEIREIENRPQFRIILHVFKILKGQLELFPQIFRHLLPGLGTACRQDKAQKHADRDQDQRYSST